MRSNLKSAVTRFKCIVKVVDSVATLFEIFKIPLARFGSFVLLSFRTICLHDFLGAYAAKSMHASSFHHADLQKLIALGGLWESSWLEWLVHFQNVLGYMFHQMLVC